MPPELWAALGGLIGMPFSALITVVLLVVRGKLVPVSTVIKLEQRYQDELARLAKDVETWKAVGDRERDNNVQTRAQLDRVLIVADTTERLMTAMRARAELESP